MNHADTLELRPRLAVQARQQKNVTRLVAVGVVATLVVVTVVFAWKIAAHGVAWEELFDAVVSKVAQNPLSAALNLLMLLLVLAQLGYLYLAQRHERLVLSPQGIAYRSPLPAWLSFVRPGWSLSWSQVRAARLRTTPYGHGPQTVALEIEAGGRTRTLYPWTWVDPADPPPPIAGLAALRQLQKKSALEIAAEIDDTPLMRYFSAVAAHVPLRRDGDLGNTPFALEKNPASLALVVAFFMLVGYAFADGLFLLSETYADEPPWTAFVALGVVAAIVGAVWLRRAGIPVAESLLLAALAGAAAAVAAYPGGLRLNALTDSDGLRTYEYRLTHGLELEPLAEGPPALRFPRYHEYWARFRPGSVHRFELRRGGLGFYQLNMAPVEQELRAFYEKRAR